ncbi:acetyltransferase [Aliidiomarina haloalkalitolerans]|nr:acetyltransferase [Aliidiomarina haloalkalitolerans]
MKRLFILGSGGFGRTVGEAAKLTGDWEEIAMLDDNFPQVSLSGHFEVVGRSQDLKRIAAGYDAAICAIGNGQVRKKLTESILDTGLSLATIIHPRAYVSADATVGAGTSIMAGVVVGPYAKVGRGCILNANATADHDSIMEDYAHLGVGVAIAGSATLREGAWLQAGRSAGYGVDVPAWEVWK